MQRALECFVGNADELGRQRRAGNIERVLKHGRATTGLAQHRVRRHAHLPELHARGIAGVRHHGALHGNALGTARHQEERDAITVAGTAAGAAHHDQRIGDMPVDDEDLGAIEHEPAVLLHCGERLALRAMRGAFVDRQRREVLAGRDGRQEMRLLRCAAAPGNQRSAQQGGGEERRRGQRAA